MPLAALGHSSVEQVQIVDSQIRDHYKSALLHTKVKERLQIRAIIANEHILLECQSDNCEQLAAGVYMGEIHKDSVRLGYEEPLTHKWRHENLRVVGAWN